MNISSIYYLASSLIIFQLLGLNNELINQIVYLFCALGIATLGVAHGAIDHVLEGSTRGSLKRRFIYRYLLAILIALILWWFFPSIGLTSFILFSAFHFGQTQLSKIKVQQKKLNSVYYLSWGILVLSSLLFLNTTELSNEHNLLLILPNVLNWMIQYSAHFLLISGLTFIGLSIYFLIKHNMETEDFFSEIYVLALITLGSYLLPPFVAFSLFFIFIHSLRAINQEYTYCIKQKIVQSKKQLFMLFVPLTSVSIIGSIAILGGLFFLNQTDYIPYAIILITACVTVPHTFVMNYFYSK